MSKTGQAITPEEKARRDRVRLMRFIMKALAKYNSLSNGAVRLFRDGVRSPDGWAFDFGQFFHMSNDIRAFLYRAIESATEPGDASKTSEGARS